MTGRDVPPAEGRQRPGVVVTGVSTGIGHATARLLLERGWTVFGSLRAKGDRKRLTAEFGPGFIPLLFDVTDERAILAAAGLVADYLGPRRLDALVNNAGIAVAGPAAELPLERYRHQFEVNLFGQIAVTRAFLPLLGRIAGPPGGARSSRIVTLSSVSGRVASPFLAPYAASKHALEAWSDSLRRELLIAGIEVDVSVIAPGPIRTPIWDKADAADRQPYAATPYAGPLAVFADEAIRLGRRGLPPEAVARTVLAALTARRPKARYRVQRRPLEGVLLPCLPKRVLDRLIARHFARTL